MCEYTQQYRCYKRTYEISWEIKAVPDIKTILNVEFNNI